MVNPNRWYTLDDDHNLVLAGDGPLGLLIWARWMSAAAHFGDAKRVAYDEVEGVGVSTIFLGLDHRRFGDGPPLVFETLVSTDYNERETRYSTWDEALAGHNAVVAELRARLVVL